MPGMGGGLPKGLGRGGGTPGGYPFTGRKGRR
jgi:hypothetical protein